MKLYFILTIYFIVNVAYSQSKNFEGTIYYKEVLTSNVDPAKKLYGVYQSSFQHPKYFLNFQALNGDSTLFVSLLMNFSDTTKMYASYNFERLELVPRSDNGNELNIDSDQKKENKYTWSISVDKNDTVKILGQTAYKLTMSATHSLKPFIEVKRTVYLAKDLFFNLPEDSKYDNLVLSHNLENRIPLKIIRSTYFSEGVKSSLIMEAMVIFDKKLPNEIFYPIENRQN